MKKCFECDSTEKIEEHHVIPRVLGGTKTIPLCIVCHGLVHGRDFVKSRNLQKAGIEKAKLMGKYKSHGRVKGYTESLEDFLKKPIVKRICVLKHSTNLSYRDIKQLLGCSLGLVQKVYKTVPEDVSYRIYKEQDIDIELKTKNELKIDRLAKKIERLKQNK